MLERVRAIIRKDDLVLMIHRIKKDREYWVFPGGGIEDSDVNKKSALIRECHEELGVDIKIGKLFGVSKFGGGNGEQVEYFYICEIIGGTLGTGNGPEFQEGTNYKGEYHLEWVLSKEFASKNIQPEDIKEKLIKLVCNDDKTI